ncbi:MAG TPA: hypothetical protein VFE41_01650 [Acetobacteraceae bacterium]|nr:hypothetical protein [Acetobacteraceae bacterium]
MEAAVNGQADLLVTFKRRDFGVVGERFGIRVCSPGEAIRDQGSRAIGMRKSNFALRLQPSLLEEARKLANEEGVALNQPINVAVAEKLSALRTESYFRERAARGDVGRALAILDRAGVGNPSREGDELTGK